MKKQYHMLKIGLCVMLAAILIIGGCKQKSKKTKNGEPKVIVAKMQSSTTKLYFKGTLAPLKTLPVISPVDGTVTELYFKYGDFIKKGQKVVAMDSEKLADDYREAVTKFLQAKDTYENSIKSYEGTEALNKAGVISADEYRTARSQHETNILNYYQAKFDLEKVLMEAEIDPAKIEQLSLVDTDAVNQILQRRFRNLIVKSPGDGVVLFPVSDGSSDKDKGGKLTVGADVKRGQSILSVGDLSGLSMTIQVSEININKMHTGLKAIVMGDAFPQVTLHGEVTSVAKQANPDQSDGGGGATSSFNIEVEIPKITEKERKMIHVGMTASVEIDIKNPPRILLPINAVTQKNGGSVATIIDPKTGKQKTVPVMTGETTLNEVTILEGIKPGDKVVIHD